MSELTWADLPEEMHVLVLAHLPTRPLLTRMGMASKYWYLFVRAKVFPEYRWRRGVLARLPEGEKSSLLPPGFYSPSAWERVLIPYQCVVERTITLMGDFWASHLWDILSVSGPNHPKESLRINRAAEFYFRVEEGGLAAHPILSNAFTKLLDQINTWGTLLAGHALCHSTGLKKGLIRQFITEITPIVRKLIQACFYTFGEDMVLTHTTQYQQVTLGIHTGGAALSVSL